MKRIGLLLLLLCSATLSWGMEEEKNIETTDQQPAKLTRRLSFQRIKDYLTSKNKNKIPQTPKTDPIPRKKSISTTGNIPSFRAFSREQGNTLESDDDLKNIIMRSRRSSKWINKK